MLKCTKESLPLKYTSTHEDSQCHFTVPFTLWSLLSFRVLEYGIMDSYLYWHHTERQSFQVSPLHRGQTGDQLTHELQQTCAVVWMRTWTDEWCRPHMGEPKPPHMSPYENSDWLRFYNLTILQSCLKCFDAGVGPLNGCVSVRFYKLAQMQNHSFHCDLLKHFFSACIVNIWNSLLIQQVGACTVNVFKACLVKFWQHQIVKFDFIADLTGTGNQGQK